MTLEEFKLKQYRILARELKQHMNKMMSFRATSDYGTLCFLDALEEYHQSILDMYKSRIRLYSPRPKDAPDNLLTPGEIAKAKLVPISTFLKVPGSKKVNCLFHADKNASMHIYPNGYHCFSCNAHGTVVDVVMKLRGCSFSQAVKFLIGR